MSALHLRKQYICTLVEAKHVRMHYWN